MSTHFFLPNQRDLREQLKLQRISIPESKISEIEQRLAKACGSRAAIGSYFDGVSIKMAESGWPVLTIHLNFGCPDGQPPDVTSEEHFAL